MTTHQKDFDLLDRLQSGFRKDGTHPDFPVQIFLNRKDWGRMPWSDLAFDLPALVFYGWDDDAQWPDIGIVFAVGNAIGGTSILVQSKHEGEIKCHPIEESPTGRKPSYLLVKPHLSMTSVP